MLAGQCQGPDRAGRCHTLGSWPGLNCAAAMARARADAIEQWRRWLEAVSAQSCNRDCSVTSPDMAEDAPDARSTIKALDLALAGTAACLADVVPKVRGGFAGHFIQFAINKSMRNPCQSHNWRCPAGGGLVPRCLACVLALCGPQPAPQLRDYAATDPGGGARQVRGGRVACPECGAGALAARALKRRELCHAHHAAWKLS